MTDSAGWVVVDDRDPGISYGTPSGGVLWHGGVSQEYDQTTTGLDAGDTATYYFDASTIGVFGTYGPVGVSGPPVAVYQVDDSPATTVTAPTTQATLYRQTFWTSPQLPSLAPGAFHKLVVIATAPNDTLWLDYLAYPPTNQDSTTITSSPAEPSSEPPRTSPNAAPSTPAAASTPTSKPSLSSSSSIAPIVSTIGTTIVTLSSEPSGSLMATTSGSPAPTTTPVGQSASGTSNLKKNMVAIAAGIAFGTLAFILIIIALVYIRRRRSRPPAGEYSTVQGTLPRPLNSSGTRAIIQREADSSPNMSGIRHTTLAPAVTPQRLPFEDSPSYSSVLQQEDSEDQRPRPLPPVPVRAFDGGVRLMGGPPEIPPEYQENY